MKIALVDKHPLLRRGLIAELDANFTGIDVTESDKLLELRDLDLGSTAEIVIVGLDQLTLDRPSELMQLIRRLYPVAPVIILDYMLNPAMAHFFLSEGVMGYVAKDAPLTELIDCIRLVMKGKRHISPDALIWMLTELETRPKGNRPGTLSKGLLTRQELEIAICIANGMPLKWIADFFCRKQVSITMMKSTIFRKLGVGSVVQLKRVLSSGG